MEDTDLLESTNALQLAKGLENETGLSSTQLWERASRSALEETGQETWHAAEMA